MCRSYRGKEGEEVFEVSKTSGACIVGVFTFIGGLFLLILFSTILPSEMVGFSIIGPLILLIIGVIIICVTGGRWVVINKESDQIYLIKGYTFNCITRKNIIGKISELNSILSTVRVQVSHHHDSDHHSTTSTHIYHDVTFHFTNGGSITVGAFNNQMKCNNFIMNLKEWLDTNYPNNGIRCGDAKALSLSTQPVIIQQTLISNPNQMAEQELRSLIVQYQMSDDYTIKSKGQTLAMAMEYNSNSLVGTFIALKQQNPIFTTKSEEVLLSNAQNIINAKGQNPYQEGLLYG